MVVASTPSPGVVKGRRVEVDVLNPCKIVYIFPFFPSYRVTLRPNDFDIDFR